MFYSQQNEYYEIFKEIESLIFNIIPKKVKYVIKVY